MSMWTTPKTDWLPGDTPTNADANRWESNTAYLYEHLGAGGGGTSGVPPVPYTTLTASEFFYGFNPFLPSATYPYADGRKGLKP